MPAAAFAETRHFQLTLFSFSLTLLIADYAFAATPPLRRHADTPD
jgi:hypothetical protein